MNCPHCQDTVLTMSERQGIEIDYCPKCRGVWLDRGELDKIIEKSLADTQSATRVSQTDYKDQHRSDYKDHYKHKRKKSFLEDLFD